MITNPIIPIWLMAIVCVVLLVLKRKGIFSYVRQVLIVVLLFLINIRIMVPSSNVVVQTPEKELYVMFVIDNTISMLANDYDSNKTERLTAVKNDCKYIIDEFEGAKYGVITFANTGELNVPFTQDRQAVINGINALYPLSTLYARGTSLNACEEILKRTLERLDVKSDAKAVLFFLSDGEVTNDNILKSFRSIKKLIHGGAVLGYGTTDGGTMTVYNSLYEEMEVVKEDGYYGNIKAVSKMNPDNLESIASDFGVEYIHMRKTENIDDTLDEILNGVSTSYEDEKTKGFAETYFWFAIPMGILLIYEYIEFKRKV